MATNVTSNSVEFFSNILKSKEDSLEQALKRIEKYNTETIPYKASLKKPKILEPMDPDKVEEVIGLRRQIDAYRFIINGLNNSDNIINPKESMADLIAYLGIINKRRKTEEIRLFHAKERLRKKIEHIKEVKKKKPEKYGNVLDKLSNENGNSEIKNNKMKIFHYNVAVDILERSIDKKVEKISHN